MESPEPSFETFAARGWAVAPSAISKAAVARLRAAAFMLLGPTLEQARAATDTSHVWQMPGARQLHPGLADAEVERQIAAFACELLGCPQVQLLQDVLLCKPPRCSGQIDWHRDDTYVGFLDRPAILTVRLALTDSTEAMGCMEVIDASHTWPGGPPLHLFAAELVQDIFTTYDAEHQARIPAQRLPLPLRAGDLAAHDSRLLHGSFHNPTQMPRLSFIFRLFDARCRLRDDLTARPEVAERFPTTPEGHMDPQYFPLFGSPDGEEGPRD